MGSVRQCSTKQDFDAALQAAGDKLVVVDFTASWCGPCKMIKPVFEDLAKKYTNSVFLKVDVDENRATAQAYRVSAMPTFIFFRKSQQIDQMRGADRNQLARLVERHSSGSGAGSFSGKGNTLAGGSTDQKRRHNPLGDESDEEEEGIVDPAVQAFLASQSAAEADDTDSLRMKEERIRLGGVKSTKSRFQREKEETERKKAEQEKEAASAYQDFVQAMDGGSSFSSRSGPSSASARNKPIGFVSAGGASSYAPTRTPASASSSGKNAGIPTVPKAFHQPKMRAAFGDEEEETMAEPARAKTEATSKKGGAMASFLGELQREQAQREERYKDRIADGQSVSSLLALEGQKVGSRDLGDPLTTNVCVLNLPANISESALGDFFCQWGDIGTVKIMWPRGEDAFGGAGGGISSLRNAKSAGLTGFICFMTREDAEFAIKEADGIHWGGAQLKTSWGKAMPKPSRPAHMASRPSKRPRSPSRSPGPDTFQQRSHRSGSPSSRWHRREDRSPSLRSALFRQFEGSETERVIRTVAGRIREYGSSFENLIRAKEAENPRFEWLKKPEMPEAQYFRCLLDSRYIPELPIQAFSDEGYASLYDSDSGEDSEAEMLKKRRKTEVLGKRSQKRFEAMLRSITPRRERIARATAFAIEHAYAAEATTDILVQSLLLPATPLPRKLARLYVLSDILHNCAAPLPNAWKYRAAIESCIVIVFQHLGDVAKSYTGIMKQEGLRSQVRTLLDVWDSWMVFEPGTLEELKRGLSQGSPAAKTAEAAATTRQGDAKGEGVSVDDAEDVDGAVMEPSEAVATAEAAEDDVDGDEF